MLDAVKKTINELHAQWRYNQLGMELDHLHLEIAELSALVGKIQKERAELAKDIELEP